MVITNSFAAIRNLIMTFLTILIFTLPFLIFPASASALITCTMNANPSSGNTPLSTLITVGIDTSGMPGSKMSHWDLDGDGTYETIDTELRHNQTYTTGFATRTVIPKFKAVDSVTGADLSEVCSATVTVLPAGTGGGPPPPPPSSGGGFSINIERPKAGYTDIGSFITNILTVLFGLAALIVLFMLIWGAYEWITSGGDKEAISRARGRIIASLIGLAVLGVSIAIASTVAKALGFEIFTFIIPPAK